MEVFAVDFRGRVRNSWGLCGGLLVSNRASFEGRRGGGKGQGAGVVQLDVDGGGNVGKEDLWWADRPTVHALPGETLPKLERRFIFQTRNGPW
jgi:hypothetical protein